MSDFRLFCASYFAIWASMVVVGALGLLVVTDFDLIMIPLAGAAMAVGIRGIETDDRG